MVINAARAVAERLLADKSLKTETDRVQQAYRLLFSRSAESDETQAAAEMMKSLETPSDEKDLDAYRLATMIQAMIGSVEFRYAM
ncbi:MAG: hypothetical protein JWO08_4087, partial [Verrucomicrobiaceae bacterium]|nr:hypothetical protein [Verrucomicrobiaceae bacterium]